MTFERARSGAAPRSPRGPVIDVDARRAELRHAGRSLAKIRVGGGDHDACDTRPRSEHVCTAACGRSGCTARGCRRPSRRARARAGRREGHHLRVGRARALVPALARRSGPSRRRRRRRPSGWARPGPSRARRAPGPAASAPRTLHVTVLTRDERAAAQDASCTAQRRRGGAPVPSHPDSHGRSRNRTGSTHGWRPWGRGLSPPVGNCTPPRKQAVSIGRVYGDGAREPGRGA